MRIVFCLILTLILVGGPAGLTAAQVSAGASIGDEGVRGFYVAVGEYYRVPQREVIIIRERGIPDEELPVVFLIATRARVAPATIVDIRLRGKTWLDITLQYGLSPEVFYVPVRVAVTGPPYGKAYGYYKNKPRKEWKTIRLGDDDVINLVNLKFISAHYGYPPEEVIKIRSTGKSFVVVNSEIKSGKIGKGEKPKVHEPGKKGQQKGQGKQKGHGKKKS